MKYRKKPIVVEAIKWTGDNVKEISKFMEASMGDYIIKGVQGEFYPCKPDIFQKTYEELEYLNILDTL